MLLLVLLLLLLLLMLMLLLMLLMLLLLLLLERWRCCARWTRGRSGVGHGARELDSVAAGWCRPNSMRRA